MNDPFMLVLRLLHIGAGVMWVGAAWMLYFFIMPTLRALGPDTERDFSAQILRRQRLAVVILVATVVTVGAGLIMLLIDIGRYGVDLWFGSGFGIGITIGAAAAMVSFVLGPLLILPLSGRIEKAVTGETPTSPEQLAALSVRLRKVLGLDSAMLIVAVLFMAGARYL